MMSMRMPIIQYDELKVIIGIIVASKPIHISSEKVFTPVSITSELPCLHSIPPITSDC
jgi:hypothetical protein